MSLRTHFGRARRAGTSIVRAAAWCEGLEARRLLSGSAPVSKPDTFTINEDTPLVIHPGVNLLTLNGNSYIWSGVNSFTDADGTFGAGLYGNVASVYYNGKSGEPDFDIDFAAADDKPLVVGDYANAQRYPFQDPGHPGLDISGNGRGSNTVAGNFTVYSIGKAADDSLTNFYAAFEHHSEGGSGTVYGTVKYNYTAPGTYSGVLANDTDAQHDALTAKLVTAPIHGQLHLQTDGSFSYVPDVNYNGVDTFTYKASDGTGQSAASTVTINVTPVNDAPTFTLDALPSVPEDAGAQTFVGFGRQINAGADNESKQTFTATVTATNKELFSQQPVFDPVTGNLRFTAKPNAFGSSYVTIELKDNGGTANGGVDTTTKEFIIDIASVNDAPIAKDDAFSTPMNTAIDMTAVVPETSLVMEGIGYVFDGSLNLTSKDGTFYANSLGDGGAEIYYDGTGGDWTLEFAAPNGLPLKPGTYLDAQRYPFEDAGHPGLDIYGNGRGSNNVTGQFTILNYRRDADGNILTFGATFEHHSEGSDSDVITGTVKYKYVPAAGVLLNDSDIEGDQLSALLVAGPAHGALTLRPDGTFKYVPNANYQGVDTFTYRANDGTTLSDIKTVRITVGTPPPPGSLGSLSGFAFNDTDRDGVKDANEDKTSGKAIFLDLDNDGVLDSNERKTTTAADGSWLFDGLAAGTYHVRRVFPNGYTYSTAPIDVTLAAGQTVANLAIGSKTTAVPPPPANTASIAGLVFSDTNKNGKLDNGEGYVKSVLVYLDADNDGKFDAGELSTTTDSNGKFTFTNLAAGTYRVRRVMPSGYTYSTTKPDVTLTKGQAKTGVLIGTKKI